MRNMGGGRTKFPRGQGDYQGTDISRRFSYVYWCLNVGIGDIPCNMAAVLPVSNIENGFILLGSPIASDTQRNGTTFLDNEIWELGDSDVGVQG